MTNEPNWRDVLALAAAHLEHGWCRNHWSVDAEGNKIGCTTKEACGWCVEGAIGSASYELGLGFLSPHIAVSASAYAKAGVGPIGYNDQLAQSVEDVLALLSDAFDRLEAGHGD